MPARANRCTYEPWNPVSRPRPESARVGNNWRVLGLTRKHLHRLRAARSLRVVRIHTLERSNRTLRGRLTPALWSPILSHS